MEVPTFSPGATFLVSQRPESLSKTEAHHLAAIEGKRKEAAPGSRLLAAAAAASVLSLHLPTNTQMCGCICTEMMNNNSRGKKSRRESAGEKEAFTYRGEKNRISREGVTLRSLEGNEGSYEGDLSGEGREKATACESSARKRERLQRNCAARR